MAKPLGYYCAGSLFDEMEEKYGSQLQGLSKQQKLFLMVSIAGDLCARMEGEEDSLTNPVITDLAARINNDLPLWDKQSFLIALAHQISSQRSTLKLFEHPDVSLASLQE